MLIKTIRGTRYIITLEPHVGHTIFPHFHNLSSILVHKCEKGGSGREMTVNGGKGGKGEYGCVK